MDNALYVGLSRQMVLRREMDIVANNIANADTTGFKVEIADAEDRRRGAPAFTLGGPRPVKFVADDGVARDFGQGALRRTGAPLDLAIEGQGFFQVTTPAGRALHPRRPLPHSTTPASWSPRPASRCSTTAAARSPSTRRRARSPSRRTARSARATERVGKVGVVTLRQPLGAREGRRQPLPQHLQPAARTPPTGRQASARACWRAPTSIRSWRSPG